MSAQARSSRPCLDSASTSCRQPSSPVVVWLLCFITSAASHDTTRGRSEAFIVLRIRPIALEVCVHVKVPYTIAASEHSMSEGEAPPENDGIKPHSRSSQACD